MSGARPNQPDPLARKLYAATKDKNLVAPQTYGNATTKERYSPPAWAVRAGAGEISASRRGT